MRNSPLFVLILLLIGVVLTIGGAVAAYVGVRTIVLQSPVELPPPPQIGGVRATSVPLLPAATASPTLETPGAVVPTVDPLVTPAPTEIPTWSDPKRITVLLLGIDQRPMETGPFRTDTLIVLSMDPISKTGAMLSIPRDVYVKIPGFAAPYSPNRINAANYIGDLEEYPGGGPALAVKTVEALLGIPIHRYVVINFKAFETAVNAVGPIQVCPSERIFDAAYPDSETYGVITVEFLPGCQELDSTRLLQYARVRHNAGDDIGRANRQQEVIRAVKDKILTLGGVSALIGQAPQIWSALAENIKTNLTFDEIIQLGSLAQQVGEIKSAVLTIKTAQGGQLLPSTLQSGEQVMTPLYEEVYALVGQLFSVTQGAPSNPQASEENATVFVANGAGVDGLAGRTSDRLKASGFNVVGVGNAEGVGLYGKSEIRVYGSKFKSARYLAEVLGLGDTLITAGTDGPPGVDIMLIVGRDLAN
ncbi:MAG: LCP family protein [Anaerolineae bacterium]|nr:LCP family protein [Anaerolineae bacterium]